MFEPIRTALSAEELHIGLIRGLFAAAAVAVVARTFVVSRLLLVMWGRRSARVRSVIEARSRLRPPRRLPGLAGIAFVAAALPAVLRPYVQQANAIILDRHGALALEPDDPVVVFAGEQSQRRGSIGRATTNAGRHRQMLRADRDRPIRDGPTHLGGGHHTGERSHRLSE